MTKQVCRHIPENTAEPSILRVKNSSGVALEMNVISEYLLNLGVALEMNVISEYLLNLGVYVKSKTDQYCF